jgi:uncharacterized damage-inducible protein DinB
MSEVLDTERFPIGRFERLTAPIDAAARQELIDTIAALPSTLRRLVEPLTPAQLDAPYRDGGWTIRQVVHHIPDSHINAYVRFKWTLTEADPEIKGYLEAAWAELPDSRQAPVAVSLDLLEAVHARWLLVINAMDDEAFNRTFAHPKLGLVPLYNALALYAWHGRHHVAHIEQALRRA